MVILNKAGVAPRGRKPLVCPKCTKGKIGSVPVHSKTNISLRGKPPPGEESDGVYVKCPICGEYTLLTIE
jgi:hypothetical protein